MNMLSPGPYIFWSLAAGPPLVRGWQKAPRYALDFLAAFYAAMIITLSGVIVLFGGGRQLGPGITAFS